MSDSWTKERLQAELNACPSIAFHKLTVAELNAEDYTVVLEMPMQPDLERAPGSNQFHGGPVATLIDTAGDYAVALSVGGGVPTINIRVDYLRPATGPTLRAAATVRKVGRTMSVADIDVTTADGKLCAIGRGTYLSATG